MEGALDTVEELRLLGVKAFPYEIDVANHDEIVQLKEKIKRDLGEVDILVNNAGLLPRISLLQGTPEDIMRIFNVNLVSYFWASLIHFHEFYTRKVCKQYHSIEFLTDHSSFFARHDIKKTWPHCWNSIDHGP